MNITSMIGTIVLIGTLILFKLDSIEKNVKSNYVNEVNHDVTLIVKALPYDLQVKYYVEHYRKIYPIPAEQAYMVAKFETGLTLRKRKNYRYNPFQTSFANAEGPFQVLLSTGRLLTGDYNLTRYRLRHDINLNVFCGIKLLHRLNKKYYNNTYLSLAAYNWGEGNLDNALLKAGVKRKDADVNDVYHLLPCETQNYITNAKNFNLSDEISI